MSIFYDLIKTTGKTPCPPGSQRVKRCALILNPGSEDLLVSNTFGYLKYFPRERWLQMILERAYPQRDFSFPKNGRFSIEFWKKIPANALNTAISEFDVYIYMEPMRLFIEAKYRSPIDEDQIVKYLDLIAYHHYQKNCEDTHFLMLTDDEVEPDVLKKYRDPEYLRRRINELRPFVNYAKIRANLAQNVGWISWRQILQIVESIPIADLHYSEQAIIEDLKLYLSYKLK